MAIDFYGIKGIRSVGGGTLYVYWDEATADNGVDSYDIYIRRDDDDVFDNNYLWANVRNTIKSAILRTEADSSTYLTNNYLYYIGVRAIETYIGSDDNTYVRSESVVGDGSASVEVPDRKIAKII